MPHSMGCGTSHTSFSLDATARDVIRLSRLLTRDRDDLPADYLRDPGLRNAYIHYYLPANMAKVHLPLRELARHPGGLLRRERLRVLDLGCGPGTSVLGMLEFFSAESQSPFLEFTAVDQVAANLRAAVELFRERQSSHAAGTSLLTVAEPVTGALKACRGPYDIIIFSNVLNELFPGAGDRVARRIESVGAVLDGLLAADGACIIIEPALRETTREMLLVRDGMLARGFTVYSPCLMQDRCPALANPKDWCHEDIPWSPPDRVRELDALTGLRKDSLKFSYAVMRKDGRTLADFCRNDALRVVSEPLPSKGKTELYLCGRDGRKMTMRQDKDRSPQNAAFDDLGRGAVASFEGMTSDEKRYRIVQGTKVAVISLPGGRTAAGGEGP